VSAAPILFEDFQPGALMGECVEVYDLAQTWRWQAIFGSDPENGANGPVEGVCMAVVNMMRAYLNVVVPRPPGNVHAKQQLRMHGIPVQGESMRAIVVCIRKEMRRERRYVELQVSGTGNGGRKLFDGLVTLIWAA